MFQATPMLLGWLIQEDVTMEMSCMITKEDLVFSGNNKLKKGKFK